MNKDTRFAKMHIFGRHDGGSKGWAKRVVARAARRIAKIKIARNED